MAVKVSAPEVQQLLEDGLAYLDVRTPEEYNAGHVPGAVNIPVMVKQGGGMVPNPEFLPQVEAMFTDKSAQLVVACQAGRRSEAAVSMMEQTGYSNLRDMSCGFGGWQQLGLATEL